MSTQQKYPVSTLPPLGGRRYHAHRDDVLRKLKQVFIDAVERLDCGSLPTTLEVRRSASAPIVASRRMSPAEQDDRVTLARLKLDPELKGLVAHIERAFEELETYGYTAWPRLPTVSGKSVDGVRAALNEHLIELRGELDSSRRRRS